LSVWTENHDVSSLAPRREVELSGKNDSFNTTGKIGSYALSNFSKPFDEFFSVLRARVRLVSSVHEML